MLEFSWEKFSHFCEGRAYVLEQQSQEKHISSCRDSSFVLLSAFIFAGLGRKKMDHGIFYDDLLLNFGAEGYLL